MFSPLILVSALKAIRSHLTPCDSTAGLPDLTPTKILDQNSFDFAVGSLGENRFLRVVVPQLDSFVVVRNNYTARVLVVENFGSHIELVALAVFVVVVGQAYSVAREQQLVDLAAAEFDSENIGSLAHATLDRHCFGLVKLLMVGTRRLFVLCAIQAEIDTGWVVLIAVE